MASPHRTPFTNCSEYCALVRRPINSHGSHINVLHLDTLWSPEPRDKQILWHYRYAILKEIPQLLNKLLLCIDWTNRTVLEEMYSLLDIWPALDPLDALEVWPYLEVGLARMLNHFQLLDAKYSDTKVREYAVKCLHKFSDEELKLYLLQLMQVLKYEPHHYSALAQFLLGKCHRMSRVIRCTLTSSCQTVPVAVKSRWASRSSGICTPKWTASTARDLR